MNRIPTLDIRRFTTSSAGDRDAFVAELGAAYREWGFAGIRGHGIAQRPDRCVLRRVQALLRPAGSGEAKYHVPGSGGARGYTPFGVETAKDSKHSDLKEFWHVGREIPRDSKYADVMPPNLWPTESRSSASRPTACTSRSTSSARACCSALALHIGLPENYFADKTNFGNSILRPIHYPPITVRRHPQRARRRARGHQPDHAAGRRQRRGPGSASRKGEWVPFTADADTIVVNIGDMLQRLTNHVYPSTTHRVVNPPGEQARQPRYSTPFFLHPNPDFLIDVLPSMRSAPTTRTATREAITAHGYLEERLREIKLK